MARFVAGVALGLALGLIVTARADDTDEVMAAAAEANVDPADLSAALASLDAAGINATPRAYLIAVGELATAEPPAPVRPAAATGSGYTARVRLTHYVEYGVTYSGGHPYAGSTACSWNFAIGTRFVLPDGETFVCNDRGLLGSSGWLDLWRRPDLSARYGPFVTVRVLP